MNLAELANKQYGLSKFPEETPYAMAYVPFQSEESKIFTADQGFCLGTMYRDLNKPFYGSKCGENND